MNTDQVGGKIDSAIGKGKQAVGEAVGSDKLANEGVAQQAKGAVKQTWGNAKDAVHQAGKTVHAEHADDARHSVAETVDHAKAAVNQKIDSFKHDQQEKRSA
jgi:uncharacterized protein YjbJ (UPF0337 family)